MFRNVPMTLAVASLSLGLIACGDDPPPDPPPQPTPVPAPTPTPTATAVPDPVPAANTGPCDATTTLALKTAIEGRHKAELSSAMKPEGVFRCEHVAEGGVIEVPVTIQPKRCYSALGGSFPNITEVEMKLVLNMDTNNPLFANPLLAGFKDQAAAQDSETGPTASIGRSNSCYQLPALLPPIPMKIVISSSAGAGPLAVQIYSK